MSCTECALYPPSTTPHSHEWGHLAVCLWRLPQCALLTLEAKGRERAVVRPTAGNRCCKELRAVRQQVGRHEGSIAVAADAHTAGVSHAAVHKLLQDSIAVCAVSAGQPCAQPAARQKPLVLTTSAAAIAPDRAAHDRFLMSTVLDTLWIQGHTQCKIVDSLHVVKRVCE